MSYIGIENEFTSADKDYQVTTASQFFNQLRSDTDHQISITAIRTETGNGYYVDGDSIEILTPPIAINKGFATRLTDSLMIGRDHLVKRVPEYNHTGYSMHWNLNYDGKNKDDDRIWREYKGFGESITIPFQLFGTNPLSMGSGVRHPEEKGRHEIVGDSIISEDQIRATALMLGAYNAATSLGHISSLGLTKGVEWNERGMGILVPQGRYTKFILSDKDEEIQAQDYLEMFYAWIKPFVIELGTSREIKNLEAFVSGDKELEFDRFKYYLYIIQTEAKDFENGEIVLNDETIRMPNSPILRPSNKKRKLPLEGKILGSYVAGKNKVRCMEWNTIIMEAEPYYQDESRRKISGLETIYEVGHEINGAPKFKKPTNFKEKEDIKPGSKELKKLTRVIAKRKKREYDPKKERARIQLDPLKLISIINELREDS